MSNIPLQQKITFFIRAEQLAEVIGNGDIKGLYLDLGFEEDQKIRIWVTAVERDDRAPEPTRRSPQVAIPTPPGGTKEEFIKSLPDDSPSFSAVFNKE